MLKDIKTSDYKSQTKNDVNYIQRMASVLENNTHRKKEWLAIDDTGWIVFNIFSGLLCIFQIFNRPAFPLSSEKVNKK